MHAQREKEKFGDKDATPRAESFSFDPVIGGVQDRGELTELYNVGILLYVYMYTRDCSFFAGGRKEMDYLLPRRMGD